MSEPSESASGTDRDGHAKPSPGSDSLTSPWSRIKDHKLLQWSLAYLGAALGLAHGQELLAHNFHWPEIVGRLLIALLIVGFPVAIALAWYHGHKGMTRFSAAEMTVVSLLLVIGAGLLIVLVRVPQERTERSSYPSGQALVSPAAADQDTNSQSNSADVPRASIAVVPFVNLTGDASKEYFSDGMAEELIDALAHVPGLKVPARTSSFAYKARNTDVRRIAKDLGVAAILEGSVRSAGQRIRVTAQLVDATTGYHEWSQTYDRQFTDIFKLQDDLAAAIVQALQEKMGAAVPAPAPRAPPTRDVEAYQLYLQAGIVWRTNLEDGYRHAIALYDQAIARDPKFARAIAARSRARAYCILLGYPLANGLADAERDARQSLALEPGLAQAHLALATTYALRADWLEAEANMRAALAEDASDPEIRAFYSVGVLAATGRLREARSQASQAYSLAPANPNTNVVLAAINRTMGVDADAIKYAGLAAALGVSPDRVPLVNVYISAAARAARYEEAAGLRVRTLDRSVTDAGGAEVVRVTYAALADPAKKPQARQGLQNFLRKVGVSSVGQVGFIIDFVALDALDPAYDLVNRHIDDVVRTGIGGAASWSFLWDPEMRAFRKDPRFQEVATRLNFVEYWKQYGSPDDCDLHGGTLICR